MSLRTISLTGAALFVGTMIYLAGQGRQSQTYTCDGFTILNGAAEKLDQGRLQLVFPAFWLRTIGKSEGSVIFQSTNFLPNAMGFKTVGEGNHTWFIGRDSHTSFSLKRGINELHIVKGQMSFRGNCILAL